MRQTPKTILPVPLHSYHTPASRPLSNTLAQPVSASRSNSFQVDYIISTKPSDQPTTPIPIQPNIQSSALKNAYTLTTIPLNQSLQPPEAIKKQGKQKREQNQQEMQQIKKIEEEFNNQHNITTHYSPYYIIGFILFIGLLVFLLYVGFSQPKADSQATNNVAKHYGQFDRHWEYSHSGDMAYQHAGDLEHLLQQQNGQRHSQISINLGPRQHRTNLVSQPVKQ